MNIGIYYFTRTGHCKRIAEKIGMQMGLVAHPINDDIDWKGWKAYLKFQAYAKGKKELHLEYEGDVQAFDRLIIVSPVWGSRMPPTVKQFVEQMPLKKVDMIVSSKMDKMKGIEDCHHVVHIKQTEKRVDRILDEYIRHLTDETS